MPKTDDGRATSCPVLCRIAFVAAAKIASHTCSLAARGIGTATFTWLGDLVRNKAL